ncbi:AAA family ATPase [Nonomuraea sp. NPDC050643]|uniref:sigma factor-like helix-turn-helix DNA-binding protein n=1 Tax=Nonomuraea sp. NPDC050643 TaxID=3155660 RepID=UPI0033E1D9B7
MDDKAAMWEVVSVWPFLGRQAETSAIRSAFTGDEVDVVWVSGPAGIGKTRLAREAAAGLDCVHTYWVGATRAAAAIPFGAVAALVPDGAATGASVELIQATVRDVGRWGGRHRVAAVVDDAHLLDDASAALIAHLAARRLLFLVMTVRAGEQTADAVAKLGADARCLRLEVPGLPEDAIDELIDHVNAAEFDTRTRQRLHRLAQGNPLALRELLYGGQPAGLTDLISARLAQLDQASRHVVELVACGEPLPLDILERVTGLPAVAQAEDSGLIVVERSGERRHARLEHPLYGEVLRARLTILRAVLVHRELAEALLATPLRRRHDRLLAAVWQVEGGIVRRPELLPAGASLAIGHADLQLAERLARSARSAQPGDETDRLLAEILAYQGRTEEAARILPAAPPPQPADRLAWAVTRAETLYWGAGDIEAAVSILDEWRDHALARASKSWLTFFDSRCTDAVGVARSVFEEPGAEPKAVVWAAAGAAAAIGFLGRADEAPSIQDRGLAVAAAHEDIVPWGRFQVNTGACLAQLAGGRPGAAQAIATAEYQHATQGGAAMMLSGWALFGGLAAAARGHVEQAHRLLAEGHAGFAVNDTLRLARCCQAARASVASLRGDSDRDLFMADADSRAHASNRIFAPWVESWRAWTHFGRGDLPQALTAATTAATLARQAGLPAVEALALYDMARLGRKPDLRRLDEIEHDLAGLAGRAARAVAAQDGAQVLEIAAQEFRARGYDLHAAEAYTVAAHRYQRQGLAARAELALARAAQLRRLFPGVRTPLLQPDSLITLLSPREREVLLLAAHHTSAEIAARLGLAVPTVNNNLARAYTKLGIAGRSDLRSLLDT